MAVVPLNAGWSDIGSWSALLEALSGATGADLVAVRQSPRPRLAPGPRPRRRSAHRDRRARGPDHRRHAGCAPRLPSRPGRGDQAGPRRDRSHGRGALPLSSPPRHRWLARLLGHALAWYVRLVAATCRVHGPAVNQEQVVLAFWHEYNLAAAIATLRLRRHRYHVSFSTQTFRGEVMSTLLAALDSGSVELPAEGERSEAARLTLELARLGREGAIAGRESRWPGRTVPAREARRADRGARGRPADSAVGGGRPSAAAAAKPVGPAPRCRFRSAGFASRRRRRSGSARASGSGRCWPSSRRRSTRSRRAPMNGCASTLRWLHPPMDSLP